MTVIFPSYQLPLFAYIPFYLSIQTLVPLFLVLSDIIGLYSYTKPRPRRGFQYPLRPRLYPYLIYLTVRAEYEDGTAATGNATLICHGAGRKQGINSEAIGYWFKENGEVTYSVTYVADIDYNNSYLQTDNGRIALCEGEIIYSDVTETGGTVEIEIILPNEMKN